MIRASLILLALLLCGCTPMPPDNAEVQRWFEANFESLEELAALGMKHRALRRVEPSLRKHIDYYVPPSEADLQAERRAFELVEKLDVDFVMYWRDGRDKSKTLYSMKVPYYRWGLALGGYSKSIYFESGFSGDTKSPSGYSTFVYLDKPGWFIDVSDTR